MFFLSRRVEVTTPHGQFPHPPVTSPLVESHSHWWWINASPFTKVLRTLVTPKAFWLINRSYLQVWSLRSVKGQEHSADQAARRDWSCAPPGVSRSQVRPPGVSISILTIDHAKVWLATGKRNQSTQVGTQNQDSQSTKCWKRWHHISYFRLRCFLPPVGRKSMFSSRSSCRGNFPPRSVFPPTSYLSARRITQSLMMNQCFTFH